MTLFSRAIIYITRERKKNITIFFLVFLLGTVITGSYCVQKSVTLLEQNMLNATKVLATITENKESSGFQLDETTIEEIGNLEYVDAYDYNHFFSLYSSDIVHYMDETEDMTDVIVTKEGYGEEFKITGVHNPQIFDCIIGNGEISSGRSFTDKEIKQGNNIVIVSDYLAEKNNLILGDKIDVTQLITDQSQEQRVIDTNTYELEIVGIYTLTETPVNSNDLSELEKRQYVETQNVMYTPNNAVVNLLPDISGNNTDALNTEKNDEMLYNRLLLKDVTQIEEFRAMLTQMFFSKIHLEVFENDFMAIATSFEFTLELATKIFYIGIVSAILILSIVYYIFVKNRQVEFGIYRSLGATKGEIIMQVLLEVFAIAILAIILAIIVGNTFSQRLTSLIIKEQITSSFQIENNGMTELVIQRLLQMPNYNWSSIDILKVLIINFAIIIASVMIPLYQLLQYNPKKNLIGG